LRTILATHVTLKLVYRRPFRPANDVERYGLIGIASEAANLKIAVARVQRIAEGGRWLRRPLKGQHAHVPSLAGEAIGFETSFFCHLRLMADSGSMERLARLRSHVRKMRRARSGDKPLGLGPPRAAHTMRWSTPKLPSSCYPL